MMLNMFSFEIRPACSKPAANSSIQQVGEYIYNPSDQIGLGFASNVYLGRQKRTDKPVAIKIINTAKQDSLGMQLLEEEIKALEKIKRYNCKHLLLLENHFTHNDKLYIVTEYCEGKNIAKLLRQRKTFNQIQAQTLMKQILQAYAEVYELGLVHRDLKLSNLLVKEGKIKLADFGFSVQIINCIDEFTYNAGSPYYMPPESLKRNRFSFKSDVWALGVMAYELVFGQLPYREKVDSLQYQKIMNSNIQDLFVGKKELSSAYKQFITECMHKDMQKRATSQFVINYYWPQAKFSLQDILGEEKTVAIPERPKLRHNLSSEQLRPNMSAMNSQVSSPTYKNVKLEFVQNEVIRPRQYNKTLHENHQKIINAPSNFQIPLYQVATSTQRPSIKSFHSSLNNHGYSNPVQLNNFQDIIKKIQIVVLTQISYCKFLYKLLGLIGESGSLPEGNALYNQLSYKILSTYCELLNLMNGVSNRFSNIVLGPHFMTNQTYARIRRQVEFNHLFYQSKLNICKENITQNVPLLNSINYLSANLRQNYKLLFWLCQYFELQQMEASRNVDYFVQHSNVIQLSTLDLGKKIEVSQYEISRLKNRVASCFSGSRTLRR